MEQQEIFKNGLQAMRRLAAHKHNSITIREILGCFPTLELGRDEIALIYNYADEEGITIEDYKLHDTRSVTVADPELTGEDKAYFQMYMDEMKDIEPCDEEEQEMLLERLCSGEEEVITRLTEGNLHMVLETARRYAGSGVLIGDLVQEGNMALFMALNDLASGEVLLAGGADTMICRRVEEAMQALVDEFGGYRKAGNAVARETNLLMAAAMDLEEELGREATLAELAEKVQMPEDKVRELVRVSLNAAEYANNDNGEE